MAFIGTQTSRETPVKWTPAEEATLTFDVELIFEGDLLETVAVETPDPRGAACGVDYEGQGPVGLVVYGTTGEPLRVNSCSSRVPAEELEAVFGPGTAPHRQDTEISILSIGLIGIVAIGVGAGAAAILKRRPDLPEC